MRVAVLDIEPIEPPLGGNRLRLKGLYHALGPEFETTYVGAFHWKGPTLRRLRHAPNFTEITVPFSEVHLAALRILQANAGSYSITDASFPLLCGFSEDYCLNAKRAAREADIVIFSHPWAYATAGEVVQKGSQLLVYDAHNVEGVFKRQMLDGTPAGRVIAAGVEGLERELCRRSDIILTCSHQDRLILAQKYGLALAKIRVFPNGAFTRQVVPATALERVAAKAELLLDRTVVALFIGGHYPPNTEAAVFIRDQLAPACPEVTFAILGDVGDALVEKSSAMPLPRNMLATGRISEEDKFRWLRASDIGINPMFSGSGTNLKMVEYMAAGLPVVATQFGARGFECVEIHRAAAAEEFAAQITTLARNPRQRRELGRRNRRQVEREFDWATISGELGAVLARRAVCNGKSAPFFTVAVVSLERPQKLRRLLDLLAVQSDRDFEVILVDQSARAFDGGDCGLDLTVLRSAVRAQCHARNFAAAASRGQVIAFIDDDCEPCDAWLAEARVLFERSEVVGVEGRCYSDLRRDPAWRSVDNYGAEGAGFMTCNLFVRAEAFYALGGFDVCFDEDQFRYDTDLGWRLQNLGEVPFSEKAFVYHPPWSRAIRRESTMERDRLFQADAILLSKHPERYRELFLREGHWRKGRRFWVPFVRGAEKITLELPDYIREFRAKAEHREAPAEE